QAEDGIRDFHVTGVQTCALPICYAYLFLDGNWQLVRATREYADMYADPPAYVHGIAGYVSETLDDVHYEIMHDLAWGADAEEVQIGRASCRERVRIGEGATQ